MRLLFVLENYLPHIGGVEIVFKNLCEGLAKRGHHVTILTHHIPGTKREERINGVRIVRVPSLDNRYLFTICAIPKAIALARKADIVHTTTYNAAFPAWLAATIARKPCVLMVHEVWAGRWRDVSNFGPIGSLLHEALERPVHWISFDRYITPSEATKRDLIRHAPRKADRIVTIHNGFDPAPWKAKHDTKALRKKVSLEGRFVIFASGRPGASKGFDYLVKAFPAIKQKIPEATLALMLSKDPQYAHKVEEYKAQLAGEDVLFLDPQPYAKLPAFVQMADCVVVPSTSEGFGYAIVEANAAGTPLVATSVASIPEVISGKHILVAPKDPNAIAQGVIRVHGKRFAKTKLKQFPWSETIAQTERLYSEIGRRV